MAGGFLFRGCKLRNGNRPWYRDFSSTSKNVLMFSSTSKKIPHLRMKLQILIVGQFDERCRDSTWKHMILQGLSQRSAVQDLHHHIHWVHGWSLKDLCAVQLCDLGLQLSGFSHLENLGIGLGYPFRISRTKVLSLWGVMVLTGFSFQAFLKSFWWRSSAQVSTWNSTLWHIN